MWFPVDEPWQYRVLDQLAPGIDSEQLIQARAATPTERVEAMCRLVELAEQIGRSLARQRTDERS
ncbi:MAG: hypothetical protein SF187_01035 [Deltaproteobacteria bacterium]|nr:hypothetical protein [Deltaproteobacteria bacterium]